MWILTYVRNVKKRLNINIIFWKWKDQNRNNLKLQRNLNAFIRLVENSWNNLTENTPPHILTKDNTLIDMENGEDMEKIDLVVDKILNTEFIENCSNYNLFLGNNLTSNNSFSIILSLKGGN